ncbi:hypothetical protein Tco_1438090 [Tanacetum coccineum]
MARSSSSASLLLFVLDFQCPLLLVLLSNPQDDGIHFPRPESVEKVINTHAYTLGIKSRCIPSVGRYSTVAESVVTSSSRQLIGLEHDYSAHK